MNNFFWGGGGGGGGKGAKTTLDPLLGQQTKYVAYTCSALVIVWLVALQVVIKATEHDLRQYIGSH